jgi:hypothetical protein
LWHWRDVVRDLVHGLVLLVGVPRFIVVRNEGSIAIGRGEQARVDHVVPCMIVIIVAAQRVEQKIAVLLGGLHGWVIGVARNREKKRWPSRRLLPTTFLS